jgi:hypothetical protein
MKPRRPMTRRSFLKSASAAAIAAPMLLGAQEEKGAVQAAKSRVVLLRDLNVLDENGQPRQDVVLEMLDTGLKTLTGTPDPQSAWKTIIKPADVVGIKNNRWGYLQTTPQVQNALKKRVLEAGVEESNVSIDDLGVLQNPVFLKSTALINARPSRSPSTRIPAPTWPRSGTCRSSRARRGSMSSSCSRRSSTASGRTASTRNTSGSTTAS